MTVLVHGQIPPNDGGISIGQAAIAVASSSSRLSGVEKTPIYRSGEQA
jgi:hypothetical protein